MGKEIIGEAFLIILTDIYDEREYCTFVKSQRELSDFLLGLSPQYKILRIENWGEDVYFDNTEFLVKDTNLEFGQGKIV